MRGVNAFVYAYNKNNSVPISLISMGEHRNIIKDNLGNKEINALDTPNYSTYGYYVGEKNMGTYEGDDKAKQILVLRK